MVSATVTSRSNWHPIDQRFHANGSCHIRYRLLCLLARVLSTYSRWASGNDIYMLEWEQSLIEHRQVCGELYGRSALLFFLHVNKILYLFFFLDRCIDDGFMTTNLSFDEIKAKLDTADHKDRNIRIK